MTDPMTPEDRKLVEELKAFGDQLDYPVSANLVYLAASRIEALSEGGGLGFTRRPEHCAGETEPSPGAGKWRKRPVVVDAWRWSGENWSAAPDWLADAERLYGIAVAGEVRRVDPDLQIFTLEGVHTANAGDWIIRDIQGELYPCKPDIFAATYEPAGSMPGDGSSLKTPSQGGSSPAQDHAQTVRAALEHAFGEPVHIAPRDFIEKVIAGCFCRQPSMSGDQRNRLNGQERRAVEYVAAALDLALSSAKPIPDASSRDGEKTALKAPPQVEGEGRE